MRIFLLALFVGLALASVDESAFKEGRVYTFRYEAQLVTGSPQSCKLWSGLRLTANLNLYFFTQTNVTAKLIDVNLEKMDKFVEDRTPRFFMQPEEKLLDGIEADVNSIMVKQLEKEFSFKWNKGKVSDINFGEQEPVWCANIKRGVIGLLEVNLDGHNSVGPIPDKATTFDPWRPSYTVWENSLFGYCRTIYTPKPDVTPMPDPADKGFYLTKVRDYTSCVKTSPMVYTFDNFRSEKDNVSKHLDMQAEVTYAIKGDKSSFIIFTAMGESKITFVPYAHQDGNVQTSINQTLYLLNAQNIPKTHQIPLIPINKEGHFPLQMQLPMQDAQACEPYQVEQQRSLTSVKPLWTLAKMDQLLTWVANETHEYPAQDVLMTMQTLIEMVRLSQPDMLKKLLYKVLNYEDLAGSAIGPLKLKIYWNMLIECGATSAANVALDYCLKHDLLQDVKVHSRCVSAVTSIGLMAPPSHDVIKQLKILVERTSPLSRSVKEEQEPDQRPPEFQKMREMKMVAVLAMGAIVGRAEDMKEEIIKLNQEKITAIETIVAIGNADSTQNWLTKYKEELKTSIKEIEIKHDSLVGSFSQLIKNRFLDTGLPEDKILGLSALRNAHVPSTLELIKPLLFNFELDPIVRMCAIQAFEKFKNLKQEVVRDLEQVLKNPSEKACIRIQAFRSLVNIRAPVEVFVRLADSIQYEKERQVSTYVWSTFHKLANCSFHPYRHAAASFRSALPFIQPIDTGTHDSQYRYQHQHLANDVSILEESSIISDPEFVIGADIAAYLNLFGTTSKAIQVSLWSESAEAVFKKLVGPKGFFTDRNSLFDLLKRTKRGTNANDIITEIVEKLDIKPRDFKEIRAFIGVQSMNNIIRVYDMSTMLQNIRNLETVQADIDEQKWKNGVQFNQHTSGIRDQFFMELPTESGFPVSLQMGLTYSAKVSGVVDIAVESSIYKNTRGFNPPTKVKAGLYVNPRFVGSVMGKMAVDGYIFQTGSVFHGLLDVQTPFTINGTADLKYSRLSLALSPPVNMDSPVVKLELKPYVYSRAVDQDVSDQQRPVNRRPVFHTMQPVMVSNGARIQQVKKSFGECCLGYNITWQGQYLWRALPSATAPPMIGRAHYALYVSPGLEQPATIRADIQYLSQPRYIAPAQPVDTSESSEEEEEAPTTKQGACDGWWAFLCYGTSEEDAVEQVRVDATPDSLPSPLPDIPVLGPSVTFQSVKQKIEIEIGHGIQPSNSEWGFIVVVNSSSPQTRREAAFTGLMQAWREGHFHQSFFTFARSSVPSYDSKPWKMTLKTSTILPSKRMAVSDLLKPEYQLNIQSNMYQMMRRKEHRIINKYFQQLLMTKLNSWAIQRLPSLDPQIMLDRIVPEVCIEGSSRSSVVRSVRAILQTLLPLSNQLRELRGELKDAFKLTTQQELLKELGQKIYVVQTKLTRVLSKMKRSTAISELSLLATSYAMQQVTQCVRDFREIVERALSLSLVQDPAEFIQMKKSISKKQYVLFIYSIKALNNRENYCPDKDPRSDMSSSARSDQPSSNILCSLSKLSKDQTKKIRTIWKSIIFNVPINYRNVMTVIVNTTQNVTLIDEMFKYEYKYPKEKDVKNLIFQVTTQHKIFVDLLSQAREESLAEAQQRLNNIDFYALKVQTKQLLERGLVLLNEAKTWATCVKDLSQAEQKLALELSHIDRRLAILQQQRFVLPSVEDPYTVDWENLARAEETMASILAAIVSIRDKILPLPDMPHPCLVVRLISTTICLQQKVAIFRSTLPAQFSSPAELTREYQRLDDAIKDFMLNLKPLFSKYVTISYTDDANIFPKGNILISEGMLEITKLHNRQNRVIKQLHKFLFQYGSPPFNVVKRLLQTVADQCQVLLKRLEDEAERVENSLRTSSVLTAYAVYAEYLDALQQQQNIYDILQQQLELYARQPSLPDIGPQVEEAKTKIATLMRRASQWQLPNEHHESRSTSSSEMDDFPAVHSIYENDNSQPGVYDGFSYGEETRIPVASVDEDELRKRIPLDINTGSILFIANVTYGDQKYLGFQIQGKKSVEQVLWEMAQYYPESRDHCVTRALQQDIADRQRLEKCGIEMERRVNTYQHVHLKMESSEPEMPPVIQDMVQMTSKYVQRSYRQKTTINPAQNFITPNSMQTILDFSDSINSMDMYCMTSQKTQVTQSLPLNSYIKSWYPFQNEEPLAKQAAMEMTARHYPAMCKVDHFNVKTNDGAVYSMPRVPKQCRTLLAMDCSSDSSFAITVQPTQYPAQKLQILAEEHEIWIEPDILSDRVTLNGELVDIQHGLPIIKYKKISYGQEAVALVISRTRGGILHVEYPLTGLDIYFDFSYIQIGMSNVYKSQLCGLCGNFDGQITQELEGPDPEIIYASASDFFQAYNIDDQCRVRKPKMTFKSKRKIH